MAGSPPTSPYACLFMPLTISIGPLLLPAPFVLLLLCVAVGLGWVHWRTRQQAPGERQALAQVVQGAVLVGALAARLGFVLHYHQAYLAHPWSVLDIRDGGWAPWPGLMAAWFYAAWATRTARTRQRLVLGAMAAASVLWLGGQAALLWHAPGGQSLPAFASLSMRGAPVQLQCLRGRPAVVNLWATWCPYCRSELHALAQAQGQYPEVQFVFVNQGEAPQTIAQFLQSQRLALDPVVLDGKGELARHYGQTGLPLTLFFDAQGRLVSSRVGVMSKASLQQRIEAAQSAELARLGAAPAPKDPGIGC